LGKLIRKVNQNRISAKCLTVEVWNNQIRRINLLAETKVNKFPHSREDLEGWLTEVYTWHKVLEEKLMTENERVKSAEIKRFVQRRTEMIVSEQKKMLASLLERLFNKVSLDRLLVKENDQISLATKPEEVRNLTRDFFQKQFHREEVENNSSNSKSNEVFGYTVQINKEEKKRLDLEGVAKAKYVVLIYTNDTTWIASSKKQLTQILELANEFYQLNRIKVNRAKSKLIVLNAEKSNIEQAIRRRKLASTRKWPTIISMLDSKSEKQSKQLCIDLGLFFVRQLLDYSSKNLLTWQQIKTAQGTNCRDKVPLWFRKLKELLIDDTKSRKVKEDFFSNDISTSALQPHCGNVTLDNRRKQWIWFTQKNKKKWYLGRVTKMLEKSALIEHWTEMHIQGDKYRLLKCRDCNLNTKGKENRCMISCNKNLIRGAAVGITKRENN
ncbi:6174_t:CDS:2, partial [Gigaspora margarita]